MKIVLACAGGMSTGMLVKKIITAASRKGYPNVECEAYSVTEMKNGLKGCDIILLGPQISHLEKSIREKYPDYPIVVINMRDYGMMDADKIFDSVLGTLNKKGE